MRAWLSPAGPPFSASGRSTADLVRLGIGLVLVTGILAGLLAASVCAFAHGHESGGVDCLGRVLGVAAVLVTIGVIGLWSSGEDFAEDLRYLTQGIDRMVRGDVIGDPIPVRSYDELGELTQRFAALREQFLDALDRERAARRALEDADAYKSEFLTAVSHELRTPLNAILGFADVLLNEIDGPLTEAQREDVELIHSAGVHLMEMFNDVLDLAMAASGRLRLASQHFPVGPVAEAVVAEAEGLPRSPKVTLRARVPEDLPEVYADPKRVRQILANLVENALKFTEEGSVEVAASPTVRGVRLEVRDTGIGIPTHSLGTIFGEFEQTAAEGRKGRGAGLGLAICRRLAELMGGTISARSERGKGSTFIVDLPTEPRRR